MGVRADLFDFELPREAIAQTPADRRDGSRLLLIDRQTGQVSHQLFSELPDILSETRTFFRNNARVLKARLNGFRSGGGKVECLLLNPAEDGLCWWCLLKPGKRLPVSATFGISGIYSARVMEKAVDGRVRVQFELNGAKDVFQLAEKVGRLPLPPYIERQAVDERSDLDEERYQTVYAAADKTVAAAAPTAGLHFTPQMMDCLQSAGHRFEDLTLHVGLGTFRPIQVEQLEQHEMHEELYEVPAATLKALKNCSPLAIGTTSLRTIEDLHRKGMLDAEGAIPEAVYRDRANLFIYPPAIFYTGALLTNFHLPRSTLICLVSAFLTPGSADGIEWCREIYQSALASGYRFYSYGDAMLIL
ncbi:MAG: tRNA preQ1(34) S-adenosylmethionine ribosyltransferase-isomerase QueA [Opitutales bacterium]|nr:tRNA preQ1(34) S-adenosylmethionine ribosyltransferase-isomerase QueA [Opitutales bacterium]